MGEGPRRSLALVLGAGESTRDVGKRFKNPDERCTVTVASLGKATPGLNCGRQREQTVAAPKVLAGGHSMEPTGQANQKGEGTGLEMRRRGQDKVRHQASQSPPLRTRER